MSPFGNGGESEATGGLNPSASLRSAPPLPNGGKKVWFFLIFLTFGLYYK